MSGSHLACRPSPFKNVHHIVKLCTAGSSYPVPPRALKSAASCENRPANIPIFLEKPVVVRAGAATSVDDTSGSSGGGSSDKTVAIGVGVAAVVFALLAVLLAALLLRWHRRQKSAATARNTADAEAKAVVRKISEASQLQDPLVVRCSAVRRLVQSKQHST